MAGKKEEESEDGSSENISVKGVSKEVFKRAKELARVTGKTMGEVTTEAYKTILGTFEATVAVSKQFFEGAREGSETQFISGFKNLEITGSDIEEIGSKVVFRNIDNLTVDDIDDEKFRDHVTRIIQVGTLRVSNKVKRSTIIPRCHYVDRIEQI